MTAATLRRRPARSRAFGLLEVMLVFALIIGAGAIVFSVYSSAASSARATGVVDQASLIAGNLKASPWAQQSTGYTGLTTARAIAIGVIPSSMTTDGSVITVYGPLTVSGNYIMPNGRFGYVISLGSGIPTGDCVKIVQEATRFFAPGYILINNSAIQNAGGATSVNGDAGMVSTVGRCSQDGTASSVSIAFVGS